MSSPWNHGKISRNAAEQLLVANGKNGAFLVRQSESVNDAYVLSLWFDGMVHHFRILRNENKFVVGQGSRASSTRMFTTLEEVIELFKQPDQGLPHKLSEPIMNEESIAVNDLEHDSEDDELEAEKVMADERLEPVEECMDISSQLMNRLATMDSSGLGNDFCNKVQSYLNGAFDRDGKRLNEGEPATDLQELIVNSAEDVKRELTGFLKRIVFLQELFCTDDDLKKLVPGGLASGSSARQLNDVGAFDDFVQDLAKCVAGIKSLQMLAKKSYQEQASLMKEEQSQTRTFEVTSGNFKTRSHLKVDITEGKLWFMKNENDRIGDCTIVEHDKILQLVKDPDTPKLTFKMAKGNREYLFKDIQAREYLCQLVQHMMNTHDPNKKQPKQISIFVGTWNMGSATPQKIDSWLTCDGTGETIDDSNIMKIVGHDIYAIGTQESSVSETTWVSKMKMILKRHFKIEYYMVAVYSLWGIRLVILAKPEHTNRISRIEKSSVKTGIANTLGNKGGVGISFDFLSTSLCFINCHLTSGNEDLRKQRRQQNYMDILKGLNLGHKSAYDLTNQFHHVFWFGDLNYRIDMTYAEIIQSVLGMDYKTLACNDQLRKEQDQGNVFVNFHEKVPHFPPTYRYKRGTRDSYEHIKVKRAGNRINVPSWCDRVLWRSFPDLPVQQNSYGCTNDIVTSDHSPVFASFDVPIKSQIGASPDKERPNSQANKPSCKIHIPSIKVKIKTVSKTDFYLEFHSVCLATSERSKTGKQSSPWDPPRTVNSKPTLTSYLEWTDSSCSLPELNPIFDNPDYLREQHMLIAVKSEAGDESYGECVVSLKGHLFNTPQKFESDLTHGGIKAGEIRGIMNILNAKQAAVLRRPPIHAKPDFAAKTVHSHRPFSCVASNVSETLPTSKMKSSSLGRAPTFTPRKCSAQISRDTSKISTYIEIPDLSPENASSDNPLYEKAKTQSSEPPPLPAKMNPNRTPTLPGTVDELLTKIGLQCYLTNLSENGFEDLIFLENISDEDLADTGIINTGHVRKILDEVECLRRAGAFNS